jgi:hypothetical protein
MDTQTIINILTPVIAPAVVFLVKLVWTKIPTVLIPVLATIIGAGGNLAATYVAGHPTNIGIAIALGLASIGAREIVDQIKKQGEIKP